MSDEDNSNNEPMQGLYLFTFLVGFVVLVWTMMNYQLVTIIYTEIEKHSVSGNLHVWYFCDVGKS